MMDRRSGSGRERGAAWRVFQDESSTNADVRPSELIRPQRAPAATAWTVFVDVNESENAPRRRMPRDSLVRRRPTEWDIEEDKSDNNKENIGYEVRRPKRARRAMTRGGGTDEHSASTTNITTTEARASPSTPATPTALRSTGKRKLKTPTPPKEKDNSTKKPKKCCDAEKPKKNSDHVRPEQTVPLPTPPPVRRPLEDITHLFIDPTAHYFQPWRRAANLMMRATSMRIL